jgi:hypothetical protein
MQSQQNQSYMNPFDSFQGQQFSGFSQSDSGKSDVEDKLKATEKELQKQKRAATKMQKTMNA